jgi:hypothetical protein
MKKNLYKVAFTTVIHCEDEFEAARIARNLCDEESFVTYVEESVEEIFMEDDLPPDYEKDWFPICSEEGCFDIHSIDYILKQNAVDFARRKRIAELEAELQSLKAEDWQSVVD